MSQKNHYNQRTFFKSQKIIKKEENFVDLTFLDEDKGIPLSYLQEEIKELNFFLLDSFYCVLPFWLLSLFFIPFNKPLLDKPFTSFDVNKWITEIRKFTNVILFSNLETYTIFSLASKYRSWAKAAIKNKYNLPPSSKSRIWTTKEQDLKEENANFTKLSNLQVAVSLCPFIFGFVLLLRFRYKGQLFSSFFNQNLPGISSSHHKISWETFQHITSKQLASSDVETLPYIAEVKGTGKQIKQLLRGQSFHNNILNSSYPLQRYSNLEKIDLYTDSILFQINPCFEKQQKQFYTGFIDKKPFFYLYTSPSFINELEINSYNRIGKLTEPFVSKKKTFLKNLFAKDEHSFENLKYFPISARKSKNFYYNFKKINLEKILDSKQFQNSSKNWIQKRILDLDELPLKLNQIFSNVENISDTKSKIPVEIEDFNEEKLTSSENGFPVVSSARTQTREGKIVKFRQQLKIFQNELRTLFSDKSFTPFNTLEEYANLILPKKDYFPVFLEITSSSAEGPSTKNTKIVDFSYFCCEEVLDVINETKFNKTLIDKKSFSKEILFNKDVNNSLLNASHQITKRTQKFLNSEKNIDLSVSISSKLKKVLLPAGGKETKSFTVPPKESRPKTLLNPRVMSGYQYPDLIAKEVYFLKNHKYFSLKSLLATRFKKKIQSGIIKVDLPPSFLPNVNYSFPQLSRKKLKLNYRDLILSYFTEDEKSSANNISSLPSQGKRVEIAYQGPSFIRNYKTNDIEVGNAGEVLSSIQEYLSFDNPLKDWKKSFLGKSIELKVLSELPVSVATAEQIEQQQTKINKIKNKNTVDSSWPSNTEFILKNSQSLNDKSIKQLLIPTNIFGKDFVDSELTPEKRAQQDRKRVLFDENLPIIPSYSKYQVAFLKESEWKSILNSLEREYIHKKSLAKKESLPVLRKTEELENEKKKGIFRVFAPAVLIQIPKGKTNLWPLTRLDYQPTNLSFAKNLVKSTTLLNINSDIKKNSSAEGASITYQKNISKGPSAEQAPLTLTDIKIELHYLPYSQNSLNFIPIEKTSFGGLYKKILTVYNKKYLASGSQNSRVNNLPGFKKLSSKFLNHFEGSFQQSWEPVTARSWLIVAQISFGLFVLQILQNFYTNYGKELISYFMDLIAHLGFLDESLKDDLGLGDNDKGFRLIRKVKKRFQDVAGIDNILPELGEIVWFLRNSGRAFNVGNILPKGILFVGSPGTGKTLLVQAIAGEAEVPVLIQSGSALVDPEQKEKGAQTLKNLFDQARQISPCIVFIDEIDTLGQSREGVMHNPMGADQLIESIGSNIHSTSELHDFLPEPKIKRDFDGSDNTLPGLNPEIPNLQQGQTTEGLPIEHLQQITDKKQANQEKLSLLMQFLIELDGLKGRNGVVVIGATNRPEVLDSALVRPGRFDRILNLAYPGKQKRIEILKLYSKNIGIEKTISWDYLANRTVNLSAADLAAAMNQSSIKAILNNTCHTIETIEHGIDVITSYSTEKPQYQSTTVKDPFFVNRFAFYQAGKAVLHTLLSYHSNPVFLHLWPKPKNTRLTFKKNLIEASKKLHNRAALEASLIGLYAGKAAELLSLSKNFNFGSTNIETFDLSGGKNASEIDDFNISYPYSSKISKEGVGERKSTMKSFREETQNIIFSKSAISTGNQQFLKPSKNKIEKEKKFEIAKKLTLWHSNLGIEDLFIASSLAYWMINRWYFYSKKIAIRKNNQLIKNKNNQQTFEIELIKLFEELVDQIKNRFNEETESYKKFQRWSLRPWWQTQITNEEYAFNSRYDHWYRIHLPDPEESENNPEWVPPDQFYHDGEILKNLLPNKEKTISLTWNDLYKIDRDYIYHGLIMTSFDKGFSLLDQNREILDFFADFLMRNQILRQEDIFNIFENFGYNLNSSKNDVENNSKVIFQAKSKKEQYVLEKKWGNNSRRQISRFLNLDKTMSKLTNSYKHPLSFFEINGD